MVLIKVEWWRKGIIKDIWNPFSLGLTTIKGIAEKQEIFFCLNVFGCHPMWCCSFLRLISISFFELYLVFFIIFFKFLLILALFFFLQNFISTGLGVNVNFLGWWIFQIGLSVARQLFDLNCLFLFWLLFGMYNSIILFFYLSPGDKNGAPQNSIKGLFLPSFIFVFLHTKIVTCSGLLFNQFTSLSLSLSRLLLLSLS